MSNGSENSSDFRCTKGFGDRVAENVEPELGLATQTMAAMRVLPKLPSKTQRKS